MASINPSEIKAAGTFLVKNAKPILDTVQNVTGVSVSDCIKDPNILLGAQNKIGSLMSKGTSGEGPKLGSASELGDSFKNKSTNLIENATTGIKSKESKKVMHAALQLASDNPTMAVAAATAAFPPSAPFVKLLVTAYKVPGLKQVINFAADRYVDATANKLNTNAKGTLDLVSSNMNRGNKLKFP